MAKAPGKAHREGIDLNQMEARTGIEPAYRSFQVLASPLCHLAPKSDRPDASRGGFSSGIYRAETLVLTS